jgi:alcohol dehydrogenase
VRNLITIKGLHNYNYEDLKYALEFLKVNHEKYPFNSVVEKEFELKDVEKAFRYAVEKKPIRVGIRIQEANRAASTRERVAKTINKDFESL